MTFPALQTTLDTIAREFAGPRLIVNVVEDDGICFWFLRAERRADVEIECSKRAREARTSHFSKPALDEHGWWSVLGMTSDQQEEEE